MSGTQEQAPVAADVDDFVVATSGDVAAEPAAVTPPAPVAEPARTPRESDDLDDSAPAAGAEPAAAAASEAGKVLQKRKQTAQERINELAREKYLLQGELAALRQQHQSSRPVAAVESQPAPLPLPSGFQFPAWEPWSAANPTRTYEQYNLAGTAALIAFDRAVHAQQTNDQSIASAFQARVDAFKADHADFDAVTSAPEVLAAAHLYLHRAIAESRVGPAVAYYLGSHVEECRRLAALPSQAAFDRAFGALEARMEGVTPASASPKPPVPPPPAPIVPVNTGGPGAVTAPDDLEFGPEYVRQMNAQDRARGRRL